MRTTFRKAGVACGTLVASAALAVTTATGAWGSNSALVVGGLATPTMHDLVMAQVLGDQLHGQQRVSINWPAEAAPYTGSRDLTLGASIAVGITNLNAEIDAALGRLSAPGEKVTVVGLSAGSLVVTEVLRLMAADANAPDPDDITFIVVADSSRQKLIDKAKYNSRYDYTYQPAPETEYDVIVVTGEYDGMADFPDRWWNFTAVLNAIAGSIFVHVPVMFTDLDDVPAENITVDVNSVGGTTTHYLVPAKTLPLVQLMPWLKSKEAELKAKVDAGYARNDVVNTAAMRTTAVPEVVEETATEADVVEEVAQPVEETPDATLLKRDDDEAADAAAEDAAAEEAAAEDAAAEEAAAEEAAAEEAAAEEAAAEEAAAEEAAAEEAAAEEAAAEEAADDDDAESAASEDSPATDSE
ncbi:MAG: PE-PPE domain-containing protein [Mycobacterium sp.]